MNQKRRLVVELSAVRGAGGKHRALHVGQCARSRRRRGCGLEAVQPEFTIGPEYAVVIATAHQGSTLSVNTSWSRPIGAKQKKIPAYSHAFARSGMALKNRLAGLIRLRADWNDGMSRFEESTGATDDRWQQFRQFPLICYDRCLTAQVRSTRRI